MSRKRFKMTIGISLIVLLLVVSLSLSWGTYKISFPDLIHVFIGKGSKLQNAAIYSIRLPRICTAIIIGIAFSLAGGLLQTVTKNDLADSGMIGINAGASLVIVIFITSKIDYYTRLSNASIFIMPLCAMIGGLLATSFVYIISNKKGITPQRLILIGIGVNIGLNALVSYFHLKSSGGDYNRVLTWTTGSLWGSNWKYFFVITPIVIILFSIVLYHHKKLDILNLGDETAIGLGLDVGRERKKILVLAALLASIATAFAGNIGFLGLLAPHIARRLIGSLHRRFLLVSSILGAIIIVLADFFSRNLFSPIEIPVGITISLLGVPYFIYLMLREE